MRWETYQKFEKSHRHKHTIWMQIYRAFQILVPHSCWVWSSTLEIGRWTGPIKPPFDWYFWIPLPIFHVSPSRRAKNQTTPTHPPLEYCKIVTTIQFRKTELEQKHDVLLHVISPWNKRNSLLNYQSLLNSINCALLKTFVL